MIKKIFRMFNNVNYHICPVCILEQNLSLIFNGTDIFEWAQFYLVLSICSLSTSLSEELYKVTQNNGRMKLEPRFSLRCWVKDTTIDTEFGKIKISQDKITHHYTIKDAVEKCYQNVQVGPTLATLLGKR